MVGYPEGTESLCHETMGETFNVIGTMMRHNDLKTVLITKLLHMMPPTQP
jgi:hypothetical protein